MTGQKLSTHQNLPLCHDLKDLDFGFQLIQHIRHVTCPMFDTKPAKCLNQGIKQREVLEDLYDYFTTFKYFL